MSVKSFQFKSICSIKKPKSPFKKSKRFPHRSRKHSVLKSWSRHVVKHIKYCALNNHLDLIWFLPPSKSSINQLKNLKSTTPSHWKIQNFWTHMQKRKKKSTWWQFRQTLASNSCEITNPDHKHSLQTRFGVEGNFGLNGDDDAT